MINFNIELPEFINNALSKPAQAVGNTLTNTWELVFGGFDLYVDKIQHKRQLNAQRFKDEVEKEIANVPPENLVEPPLHILGPTLEASKYYFDSEELRSMFAKLIAATINSEMISKAHPSFVEIIKQLSPLDAKNLSFFKERFHYPICEYKITTNNSRGHNVLLSNVFLENSKGDYQNLSLNASSMTNLQRLGLISISYTTWLNNRDEYNKFETTEYFKLVKLEIENNNPNFKGYDGIKIQEGLCQISPFGIDFIDLCL
ncbi:DUF4393 domain-containing protein [Bacillus sp. Au-Bac7]|uniref:DUF4393 domain-containing protein n=1 Tax=Bacillus sp. Au-Bac7 TaxID=2906458 RepID=UPI001E3099AC|nr:DUF4393 domain-containing protein [Bacillus sp. Au-Bac7]MCE4052010.1 DUF4393 domain-containing protein [Bacillus sp. Au-Bac7]